MSPRFAIATFMRVFDVEPKRDVVTLDELTAGLTRFIVKAKLHRTITRDVARIEAAWSAWRAGERPGGRRYSHIARAGRERGAEGARAAYEGLLRRAHGRAKTDLRLWSPALYEEGGRRDSDHVISVSCLVLDFDSGIAPGEASRDWARWYHVSHTTWSHRREHPKHRLILPLAHPVHRDDWRRVWDWAAQRSGMAADPALKSAAATFALPATPHPGAPREAFVHGGALLSPIDEGLVDRVAAPPPDLPPPEASHFRGTDPTEKTIDHPVGPAATSEQPADFDLFGPPDRPSQADADSEESSGDDWDSEFEDLF